MFTLAALRGSIAGTISRPRYLIKQNRMITSGPTNATSRIDRIVTRLPPFLRRYVTPLQNAPLTHVSAFLLLHELTAIIPLFGLAGVFHYYDYLPPYITDGELVANGIKKFGNYFRRKGWLEDLDQNAASETRDGAVWSTKGEGSVRIVTEFATAYAITKIMLPLRLAISVSATPWFARILVTPSAKFFGKIFKRRPKASKDPSTATIPSSMAGKNSVAGKNTEAGKSSPRAGQVQAR